MITIATTHRHEGQERLIGSALRLPEAAVRRHTAASLALRFPGLTTAHMGVFQNIDHPPEGTRQTELASRMQITKQALGEVVDALEHAGYVERLPDPADRRAKLVRLTPAGERVHDAAFEIVSELQARWATLLGEGEMLLLLGLLNELIEKLDLA